jgi:Zn-dependent protease with chaperone function
MEIDMNEAISFFMYPLTNSYLYYQHLTEPNFEERCIKDNLELFKESENDRKVPEIVKNIIRQFIYDELGINLENIQLVVSDDSSSPASSYGSIEKGFILVSPEFIEELRENFTQEHKFVIAHEIGHLVAQDSSNNHRFRMAKLPFQLVAYTISLCAMTYFFPSNPIENHFAACATSKVFDVVTDAVRSRKIEMKADQFAAQISPHIAAGGVEFFSKISNLCSIFDFFEHPSPQKRIEALHPLLQSK